MISQNYQQKFKKDTSDNKIIWPLVFFTIAYACGVSEKILFCIGLLWVLWISFRGGKICHPKINGFKFYLFFIFYATIIGLFTAEIRSVIRDMYYVLPTIVMILLGFYMSYFNKGQEKSIIKTVALCGMIMSGTRYLFAIIHPIIFTDFNRIKGCFVVSIYEVVNIVPVLILYSLIYKKKIFNKKIDIFIIVTMSMQIFLSLARTAILQFVLELFVMGILVCLCDENKKGKIKIIFKMLLVITIVCSIAFFVVPKDITDELFDKFKQSTSEISSEQKFTNSTDAVNHWRGYEIHLAESQWKSAPAYQELLGKGFGHGVYAVFVPYSWRKNGILINNEIPILHNGYYTLLIKGGIVGILSLLCFFISNSICLFKRKYKNEDKLLIIIPCILCIGMMLNTYTARGPVGQGLNIFWSVLIGWINQEISSSKNNRMLSSEKEEKN